VRLEELLVSIFGHRKCFSPNLTSYDHARITRVKLFCSWTG
jgi:hypothetical protein